MLLESLRGFWQFEVRKKYNLGQAFVLDAGIDRVNLANFQRGCWYSIFRNSNPLSACFKLQALFGEDVSL